METSLNLMLCRGFAAVRRYGEKTDVEIGGAEETKLVKNIDRALLKFDSTFDRSALRKNFGTREKGRKAILMSI